MALEKNVFSRLWSKVWKSAPTKALASAGAPNMVPSFGWGPTDYKTYANASEQFDPNAPPQELPLYGQPPTVLVRQVAGTLTQLEQGSFYQASYLWDGMLRDDRITGTLNQRLDRLIGAELELEPPDGDDSEESQTLKIAQDCRKLITKIVPPMQQYELMRYALGLSVGVGQVLTQRNVKSWTPTFKVWNNRFLRYDWLLRQYRIVTENRGEITIDPEDPEWIVYEPFGPHGWLHGALLRPLALPWLIRFWQREWWARDNEVHGQPLRLGVIPADRKPADEKTFLAQLANIGHEAVIRIPQGLEGNKFDVKLLERSSNNWEGFLRLIEHCDDSIAIVILGQRQSTMGQGGLKSDDKAGESSLVRITRKDAQIGDMFRQKLLMPWAEANYLDPELAPIINWQFEEPEDEKKTSEVDYNIARSLVSFKQAAAPLNIRSYMTERGYPLLTPQEEAAQKQQALKEAQDMMAVTTPKQDNQDNQDSADNAIEP